MGTSEIMDTIVDPYQCLGVAPHASQAEIRKCYKKLVLTYHPDKTRDETEKSQNAKRFLEVQEAYEIIGDDKKRKEYDDEQIALAQIKEFERKDKESREKARRRAARKDDDARRREEERRAQAEADRMAEREYRQSKKSETDQLQAALHAQHMRKRQTDAKRLAEEEDKKERARREREDRKRKDSEAKRMHEEDLQKLKDMNLQEERTAQEKEKRHRVSAQEKRDRDRRQDRASKTDKYFVPPYESFDDHVDSEPPLRANLERVYSDRGRPSKERLREPLAVPRESSQRREGSRSRTRKERESREIPREPETLRNPERERVKRELYEGSPRRMSTEPLYEHLRTPPAGPYGSPPQQHPAYYSSHSGAGYSPPPSPRPRSSMPSMNTPQQFTTPQKGRERTRDRPSVRKHADSYREPSYGPHDDDHPRVVNRDSGDSGYSTGTQSTPLKNLDPRVSSDRLGSESATRDSRKKERGKKWIQVTDDEGSADELDPREIRGSHRRSSRDDHSPRHGNSPPDAETDPFQYMTSGAKAFAYTPDNVYPRLHTRHNSEHYSGSIPKINLEDGGYSPSYKPRHHTSREVPPVAGGYYGHAPPSIIRNQTWSGPQ